MKKHLSLKILALAMAVVLVAAAIPFCANAEESVIQFGVLSDIHYYSDTLKGGECDAYKEWMTHSTREFDEEAVLLEAGLQGLENRFDENTPHYVFVTGDLTFNGEEAGHRDLARKLEEYERETGTQVLVVPGNHDIYNHKGVSFEHGVQESADYTTPEEFLEIYANLGYDLPELATFTPKEGKRGGMLSYAVTLGSYRVIAMDSTISSLDNGAKEDKSHLTDGQIGPDLLEWVEAQCAEAQRRGLTIIGLEHHNAVPHMDIEESTFKAFVNWNWQETADRLADAGMHYIFTGHLHANDVAVYTSDNGEAINDILTSTLTGYPNEYRLAKFTSTGNDDITLDLSTYDIDADGPITAHGVTFDVPFKYSYSLAQTFGRGGATEMVMRLLEDLVSGPMFGEIREKGLYEYLEEKLDLTNLIINALGTDGLAVGNVSILTISTNAMALVKDLCDQIQKLYIDDPQALLDLAKYALDTLANYEPSPNGLPSTTLAEYGFGSGDKPGNLDQFASDMLYYYYGGDEDIENDLFVQDVLDSFENGDGAKNLFALLRKLIINDIVEDSLLSKVDLNIDAGFPQGTALHLLGKILDALVRLFFGDKDILNIGEGVLGIMGYDSIDGILDALVIDEYLTDSQFEAWGKTIAWMLRSLCEDCDPAEKSDSFVTLTYSGPVEPEATVENLRLPSAIAVTLGENAATSANINWYTKSGIEGTDIELIKGENAAFTGRATKGSGIKTYCETVTRGYPGADLGILGILMVDIHYVYHHVELTSLEPGTTYSYRVGSEEKGWWSEPATIRTADNSDKFTFIDLSDPQSQNAQQYKAFASLLDEAFTICPEASFIVSGGDQVDLGTHFKHWNYMLNSSPYLSSKAFMPTTGNHEKSGAILPQYFNLPGVPEQDEDTGTYYSYDYNNAHFAVLNSNDTADDKLGDAQIEWLKKDMKASDKQWKIVVLHKAPYSNASHYDDKDVCGIRDQLSVLMPLLGVDLVLEGHDHTYLRTCVLAANMVIPTAEETVSHDGKEYSMKKNPKGTIYCIPSTSGVKYYTLKSVEDTDKLFPRAETYFDEQFQAFTTVSIDGNRLYFDGYRMVDGKAQRIDNFAIEKTAPATEKSDFIIKLAEIFNPASLWKILSPIVTIVMKLMLLIGA